MGSIKLSDPNRSIVDIFGLSCPCRTTLDTIYAECARRFAMYRKRFGHRFSQVLMERSWSDEQAASIFGVSPTMIYRYRLGQNFPEAEALARMADILDCSVDWLMGRTEIRALKKENDGETVTP